MLPRTYMAELTMAVGAAIDSDSTDVVSWGHSQLCKWLVAGAILSVTAWAHHNCVSGADPRWPPKLHPSCLVPAQPGQRWAALTDVSILTHE